jgi:1-acyl-sn-glycerol-3-phosphate acyltransferase
VTPAYRLLRSVLRGLLRFVFGFRVAGEEHVPLRGPLIAIANHRSWLDPPALAAALPRQTRFVGIEEVAEDPYVGWIVRAFGFIPLRRGDPSVNAFRQGLRVLRAGGCLVIYPEGGVNVTAAPVAPLKGGAALLSARTSAPIVPAAIFGTGRALPLGRIVPRPVPIAVRFGPPMPAPASDREPDLLDTVARMRAAIERLLDAGPPV